MKIINIYNEVYIHFYYFHIFLHRLAKHHNKNIADSKNVHLLRTHLFKISCRMYVYKRKNNEQISFRHSDHIINTHHIFDYAKLNTALCVYWYCVLLLVLEFRSCKFYFISPNGAKGLFSIFTASKSPKKNVGSIKLMVTKVKLSRIFMHVHH